MSLVRWEDVIIDIHPPYNHIMLAFLSCGAMRCPRCGSTYYKKELKIEHPYQPVNCKKCNFIGVFTDWQIELLLRN